MTIVCAPAWLMALVAVAIAAPEAIRTWRHHNGRKKSR